MMFTPDGDVNVVGPADELSTLVVVVAVVLKSCSLRIRLTMVVMRRRRVSLGGLRAREIKSHWKDTTYPSIDMCSYDNDRRSHL